METGRCRLSQDHVERTRYGFAGNGCTPTRARTCPRPTDPQAKDESTCRDATSSLTMSRLLFPCLLVFVCSTLFAHEPDPALPLIVGAARNLVATFTPEQRQAAIFPFDDDERYFWHYVPSDDIPTMYGRPRRGLTLKDMSPAQKALAAALLSAGLSQRGFIKATTIISLEDVLRVLENDVRGRRDPEKYHFSIFGQPEPGGVWGYRIEGHHVSLHFTVVAGKVVASPMFFGANPAEVRAGPLQGLRVLGAEEDKARALMDALDAVQRHKAVVHERAYPDILTERSRKAAIDGQPSGLAAAELSPAQWQLLNDLILEYVHNVPAELAEQRLQRVKAAGREIWFAWAGELERNRPHYYRVQASGFLIEYDNTQNNANHIHSVWRDFEDDFGVDLLLEHYRTAVGGHGHDHSSIAPGRIGTRRHWD